MGILSDHSPVTLTLHSTVDTRGPGMWRINNLILSNTEYVESVKTLIDEFKGEYKGLNPANKWDLLKFRIKEHSIKFCKERAKKKREMETELNKRLKELSEIEQISEDEELEKSTIKRELGELEMKKSSRNSI